LENAGGGIGISVESVRGREGGLEPAVIGSNDRGFRRLG
jgi:hypothetical protein